MYATSSQERQHGSGDRWLLSQLLFCFFLALMYEFVLHLICWSDNRWRVSSLCCILFCSNSIQGAAWKLPALVLTLSVPGHRHLCLERCKGRISIALSTYRGPYSCIARACLQRHASRFFCGIYLLRSDRVRPFLRWKIVGLVKRSPHRRNAGGGGRRWRRGSRKTHSYQKSPSKRKSTERQGDGKGGGDICREAAVGVPRLRRSSAPVWKRIPLPISEQRGHCHPQTPTAPQWVQLIIIRRCQPALFIKLCASTRVAWERSLCRVGHFEMIP